MEAVSVKPSLAIQHAQNDFIYYLKGNNPTSRDVWFKICCIIPYAGGMTTAADALIWWNDVSKKAELMGAAVPSYVVKKGFTGNGVSGYINNKFNPTSSGNGKFTQNDAAAGWYYSNQKSITTSMSSGYYSTKGIIMSPANSAINTCYYGLNAGADFSTVVGSNHLFILSRAEAANYNFHVNKLTPVNKTRSSSALINAELYTLALNNGTAAIEFGTDTIGLEFYASSFTQDDVDVMNDAWSQLLSSINDVVLFEDACDGAVIDTDKWDIVNPNATAVEFSQNDGLIMDSKTVNIATTFNNRVVSKTGAFYGSFVFSLLDIERPTGSESIREIGITNATNTNSVHLYRSGADDRNFLFFIKQSGSVVYSVNTGILDFAQVKIVIDPLHSISLYKWHNDEWLQIGVTQNFVLGEMFVYMASRGFDNVKTIIRDVAINGADHATLSPSGTTPAYVANDIRLFGAVPDATTDASTAINDALVAGDITIRDGIFNIESSIKIPSNRTIYIKNAKLRLADNAYDNHFRNSDFTNGNANINIVGQGNAVIDGNSANNSDPDYSEFGGLESENIYKTNRIIFCNVNGFSVSKINITDRPTYAMAIQKSTSGVIHDLYLCYYTEVVNQDGIAIIEGCSDIEIYNIDGHCADDFFSLNLGKNVETGVKLTDYNLGDSHDISIHDIHIRCSKLGSLLAVLVGDGKKVYNISIDDALLDIAGSIYYTSYGAGYYTTPPAKTDLYNITFESIVTNANTRDAVFHLGLNMMDITATDITNNSGKDLYSLDGGDQSDNVTINGVQVE